MLSAFTVDEIASPVGPLTIWAVDLGNKAVQCANSMPMLQKLCRYVRANEARLSGLSRREALKNISLPLKGDRGDGPNLDSVVR